MGNSNQWSAWSLDYSPLINDIGIWTELLKLMLIGRCQNVIRHIMCVLCCGGCSGSGDTDYTLIAHYCTTYEVKRYVDCFSEWEPLVDN